jgi:N-acetyltransferase 10
MKKKIDARLRGLLESSVAQNHRGFLVVVGDRGRDQLPNLHYMLTKIKNGARPSVLWCYKRDLGFSSNKQKRAREIASRQRKGLHDPDTDDPFELFVTSTNIRYT